MTISSTGPFVVSPDDIFIKISNNIVPEENLEVEWEIKGNSFEKVRLHSKDIRICLNIVGVYENCLWSKKINSAGFITIKKPSMAGYFVVRILISTLTTNECIGVSNLFKSNSSTIKLIPQSLKAEVSTSLRVNWLADDTHDTDWIGLYNLVHNEVFTKSFKAIQSISVNGKKAVVSLIIYLQIVQQEIICLFTLENLFHSQ